jgi:hypothetical protein
VVVVCVCADGGVCDLDYPRDQASLRPRFVGRVFRPARVRKEPTGPRKTRRDLKPRASGQLHPGPARRAHHAAPRPSPTVSIGAPKCTCTVTDR